MSLRLWLLLEPVGNHGEREGYMENAVRALQKSLIFPDGSRTMADSWRVALTTLATVIANKGESRRLIMSLETSKQNGFKPSALDVTDFIAEDFRSLHWALARRLAPLLFQATFSVPKLPTATLRWLLENSDVTTLRKWVKRFFRQAEKRNAFDRKEIEFCFAVFSKLQAEIGDGGMVDEYVEEFNLNGVRQVVSSPHLFGSKGLIKAFFTDTLDEELFIDNGALGYAGLVQFFVTGFRAELPCEIETPLGSVTRTIITALFDSVNLGRSLPKSAAIVMDCAEELNCLKLYLDNWATASIPSDVRKGVMEQASIFWQGKFLDATISLLEEAISTGHICTAFEILRYGKISEVSHVKLGKVINLLLRTARQEELPLITRAQAVQTILAFVGPMRFSTEKSVAARKKVIRLATLTLRELASTNAGLHAVSRMLSRR